MDAATPSVGGWRERARARLGVAAEGPLQPGAPCAAVNPARRTRCLEPSWERCCDAASDQERALPVSSLSASIFSLAASFSRRKLFLQVVLV